MKDRLILAVLSGAVLLLLSSAQAQAATGRTPPCTGATVPAAPQQPASADAYQTGFDYVTTFYPRWFYFYQSAIAPCNQLLGPNRVTALYHAIVAINVDTLYASMFVRVRDDDPVIVTVPPTSDTYSILQLDGYGDVFPGVPNNQPGLYALTGPGWHGILPPGAIQVKVPYKVTLLAVRADKFVNNVDMTKEADAFRRGLYAAPLSEYRFHHKAGPAKIVSEAFFAIPYKRLADELATNQPLVFLKTLQFALQSGTTQRMTPDEQTLSDTFNGLFSDARNWGQLAAGASAAHAAIIANYENNPNNTVPGTTWITFTDIGEWAQTPQGYLNRSSIAEYIQVANNRSAAAYYHTFSDGNGDPLDGTSQTYTLTFPPDGQPEFTRFWSVTAYLPESIELVPNLRNKYAVASYTPKLVTGSDGSVTIVMSAKRPAGVPEANWLPVPKGRFNIMLRVYGPGADVVKNNYVPPPIQHPRFGSLNSAWNPSGSACSSGVGGCVVAVNTDVCSIFRNRSGSSRPGSQ